VIYIAFLDSENWIDGILGFDMNELPSWIETSGRNFIILTGEQYDEINAGTEIFWYDGVRLTKLKNKKKIWQRLRSQGIYGTYLMNRISELLSTDMDASNFEESPLDISINPPKPFPKAYPSIEFFTEIQPGLFIMPVSKFEELDLLEQGLYDTGVYESREDCWKRAWGWFAHPNVQLLNVTWNGKPLLIEVYYFTGRNFLNDPNFVGDPEVAFSRFTVHVDKQRPHWFWRRCALPVFETLKRLGMTKIRTTPIRDTRPDWKAILKKYYGARTYMIEKGGTGESLEYDLDVAIGMVEGFPQRKTMGPGWKWRDQDIRIIEADESKLNEAIRDVKNRMAIDNDPRIRTIERDIRAWWELDKASMLLILKDGNLIDTRLFRLKEGTTNRVWSIPGSWRLEKGLSRQIAQGAAQWQRNVGYEKSLVIMPQKLYDHPQMKEKNDLFEGHFKRNLVERQDIVEVEYELNTVIEKTGKKIL